MEQLANAAVSTLASDIQAGTTSIPVQDGSNFPATGNFRIRIGSELILVIARSGNTLTATGGRGAESTVAAAHYAGDDVKVVLTAAALLQTIADRAPPIASPTLTGLTTVGGLVAGVSSTGSASVSTDASAGTLKNVSSAVNVTLNNPTNAVDNCRFVWRIKNTGAEAISVSVGNAFRFGAWGAAISNLAAGETVYIVAMYNADAGKWDILPPATGYGI